MTWPTSDIDTAHADAGTDVPSVWRAAALALSHAFNQLRNHVSAYMQGVLEAANASAARTALGAGAVGSNVFAAADTATALQALGVPLREAVVVTSNYTVVASERGRFFDVTNASVTVTLPTLASVGAGFMVAIRNYVNPSSYGGVTVSGNGGTINTAISSVILANLEWCICISTATGWRVLFGGGVPMYRGPSAAPIGYTRGTRVEVTQTTSKSTAVTANGPSVLVFTHNASLGAGSSVVFQINNSYATSFETTAIACVTGFLTNYRAEVIYCAEGQVRVRLTNISGGSLSESVWVSVMLFQNGDPLALALPY